MSSVSMSLVWLLTLTGFSCGNFPLLDVDTNMRIVLVPQDTPVGTIIYRLRASDSDNNFPLSFEVLGAVGKSLLSLNFLGCVESESLCQADVVLKKPLDKIRNYEFQLQVKDTTGDYTKVHAMIQATAGMSNFNPLFGQRILHLVEDCKEGTVLERFDVLKNELNSRIVHLEIRDKEERIGLKQRLVSNNLTEGTLFLKRKLDYETQPWFTFQLLAMNGWTNTSTDTRNILVSDVIVAVHDVQDSPPVFTLLPASVELNSSIKMGDLVVRVEAEDGDKQNKRLIRYGFLTDNNPFVVFFDLDPMTGEIRLRRNISELLGIAKPNEPIRMTIIAEEIVQENGRFGKSLNPTLERTMGNITFWFGRGNSLGPPAFSSDKYVGEIQENSQPGTSVNFRGLFGLSVSHSNPGEIIALSIPSTSKGSPNSDTYSHQSPFIGPINSRFPTQNQLINTFELIPSQGVGNFSFEIRVVDPKLLDYETYHEIKLMIMASTQGGLSSEVEVTIHIRDENDNPPVFSQSEYKVTIPEHSPVGTKVIQLKATDKDSTGTNGEVMYANLVGSDAFHLDPQTGEITVDKPELIDREVESEIRLYVEAKDGGYTEFSNPSTLRNMATATIIVKLHDQNDNKPEFLMKYYQAVLNPDMASFKTPIHVKAFDADEGPNGQIKYQSLDPKFFVDPTNGEVRIRGVYNKSPSAGDGPYLGAFRIRAYDLGNPQQSAETVVQLFSEEMVIREIQFVFPATPEKIKKNQTNIEKMLSSLTGGIVGIQKITPLSSTSRSGLTDASGNNLRRINSIPNDGTPIDENNNNDVWPNGESAAGRSIIPAPPVVPTLSPQNYANANTGDKGPGIGAGNTGSRGRSADLSSEKSLVIATVQYPVLNGQPTRVDLAAFEKAYGGGGGGDVREVTTLPSHDTEMIKLYEAENRALFWILITFLFLLLILFAIFLCCIYCPCCWLYGHCYSKGVKTPDAKERVRVERVIVEKRAGGRHSRKTYPAEETEEDSGDLESGSYRRGPPPPHHHVRREAWSGEEHKSSWRRGGPRARYQERPPTPHNKRDGQRHRSRPQEADVSLEDWDFEPSQGQRDRAEEIGPRWQNMQHVQQVHVLPPQQQPQTITVPVPLAMMPLQVQQQLQQQIPQQQQQQQQRRVGYVGQQHPGDEDFVRRHRSDTGDQVSGHYMPAEVERSQVHIPRHYPGGSAPGPDSGKQRQTRFFKTETGEVLQFADMEGEEGKELLMKRYIDDHQQQHFEQLAEGFSGPLVQLDDTQDLQALNNEASLVPAPSVASSVDRPRAALMTKRPHKLTTKEMEIAEQQDQDDDEILIRDEKTKSKRNNKTTTTKSKSKQTTTKSSKVSREKLLNSRDENGDGDDDDDNNLQKRKKQQPLELQDHESRRHNKDANKDKDKLKGKRQPNRRSHSLSEEIDSDTEGDGSAGKNRKKSDSTKPKSKSVSRSRSKSKSTSKSKSRSKSGSRSTSPVLRASKSNSKSKSPPDEDRVPVDETAKKTKQQPSAVVQQPSKSSRKEIVKDSPSAKGGDHHHKTHRKHGRRSKEKVVPDPQQQTMEQELQKSAPSDSAQPLANITNVPVVSVEQVQQRSAEDNQHEAEVDINIIPPSSAAMSDENDNEKAREKVAEGEIRDQAYQEGDNHRNNDSEDHEAQVTTTTTTTTSTSHQQVVEVEEHVQQIVQEEALHENDDEDSGIGISGAGTNISKRNRMLEKKSVFTIAYDEVARKTLMRPDTGSNSNNEAEGGVAS